MLVLACLFQRLPRPEVHYLSFVWSVFCTSSGVLFNGKARDRSEVAIVLLGRCRTSQIFKFLPQLQQIIPISQKVLQSGH